MGNIGAAEVLVIFVVALIVLGPNKLPDAARQVGKAVTEIRRVSSGFQRELRDAMEDPFAEEKAREAGRQEVAKSQKTHPLAGKPAPVAQPALPSSSDPADADSGEESEIAAADGSENDKPEPTDA